MSRESTTQESDVAHDSEAVREILAELVGQPALWAFPGVIGSSHVSLDVGPEIPRGYHVPNPNLTERQQNFHGQSHILVYSSWRLRHLDGRIFTGWFEVAQAVEPRSELSRVKGVRVVAARFSPDWDLRLDFEDGLVMEAFRNGDFGDMMNFHVNTPRGAVVVYGDGAQVERDG